MRVVGNMTFYLITPTQESNLQHNASETARPSAQSLLDELTFTAKSFYVQKLNTNKNGNENKSFLFLACHQQKYI